MAEQEKYDLSVFGDIKSKILEIIGAIVSFITFIQAFLNHSHNVLGFGFANAYRLFIALYFIVPALYLIYFARRHHLLMKKYAHLTTLTFFGNHFFFFSLLFPVLAIYYLYETDKIWLLTGVSFLSFCIIFLIAVVLRSIFVKKRGYEHETDYPAIIKIKKRLQSLPEEDKEYLVSIAFISLVATLYFCCNFKKLDGNAKPATEVLTCYNKAYNFKDSASTSADHILSDAESKLRSPLLNLAAFKILNDCKSIDTPDNKPYCDTALLPILILTDSSLKEQDNSAIKNVEVRLHIYSQLLSDSLHKLLPTLKKRKFDTTKIVKQKLLIDCYGENAKLIASAINNRINEDNSSFKKDWLSQLFLLQYKGLLWLFLLLIATLTLLYFYRKELSLIRFNNALKLSIETEGNKVKNLLYIIVLLMIPFFKNLNEEDINLDKPFINFGVSNIFPDLFSSKGTTCATYTDTVSTFRSIQIDTIKIIADTSMIHTYQDSLNEKIKYLGSKAIENYEDRAEFIEHFDSAHHTYKK